MRIQTIITEQQDEYEDIRKAIDVIRAAAPFFALRGTSSDFLYRGTSSRTTVESPEYVRTFTQRQDRRPMDSSALVHKALNERLEQYFGFPYRSGAVFCTGSRTEAESYGRSSILLPLGQYSFVWGKRVRDATHYFVLDQFVDYAIKHASDDLAYLIREEFEHMTIDPSTLAGYIKEHYELYELWTNWMDDKWLYGQYTNEDLPAAIASHNEVMVKCERYAVFRRTQIDRWDLVEASNILNRSIPPGIEMEQFINIVAETV